MAKTIIEQLLSTMTPEEAAIVRAKLDANPRLVVADKKGAELLGIYNGEEEEAPVAVAAHVPSTPSAAATTHAAAPIVAAAASTGADSSAAILAKLNEMNTSLDDRFKALDAKFVPAADLDKHRVNILTLAIKTADDINIIRSKHKSETGKDFDRPAFEKFVEESRMPNGTPRYANLIEAHDAFTAADREAARIAKGIEDGVRTRTSGQSVPGQTQSTAMSPAQVVMAKARANGDTNTKTAASAAADRLAQLVRNREDGVTASA